MVLFCNLQFDGVEEDISVKEKNKLKIAESAKSVMADYNRWITDLCFVVRSMLLFSLLHYIKPLTCWLTHLCVIFLINLKD